MEINVDTVELEQLLQRENGYVLYEGAEGRIAREDRAGTVISDIPDAQRLCQLLKQLALPDFDLIEVKSEQAVQMLGAAFGLEHSHSCSQWVYTEAEPPKIADYDIRPLLPEYATLAGKYYHESYEYVQERIAAKKMWGLFEDGALAGFIGMHPEGSMGMLEVLPEYRHKGYGYALEAYLIGLHLQKGWVPFCHVINGNEASLHLQKKLGLRCARLPAVWAWK